LETKDVYAAYTALSLHSEDGLDLNFDALGMPEIIFHGGTDVLSVDFDAVTVSGGLVGSDEALNLEIGDVIGDGWVTYTFAVNPGKLTITAEGNGNTVSDDVALTGSFPVTEVRFVSGNLSSPVYIDDILLTADNLPNGTRLSPQITEDDIADGVTLGGGLSEDSVGVTELNTTTGPSGLEQFAAQNLGLSVGMFAGLFMPPKLELSQIGGTYPDIPPNTGTVIIANGVGFGAEGDLIYVYNDGGTKKATKLAEVVNMTAP
jgi:hypothetical protein